MITVVLLVTGLAVINSQSASAAVTNDSSMNSSVTIKSASITNFGTPNLDRRSATRGELCLTSAQAADTSGSYVTSISGVGSNSFVPVKRVYANFTAFNVSGAGVSTELTNTSALVAGNIVAIVIDAGPYPASMVQDFKWYTFDVVIGTCGGSSPAPSTPTLTAAEIAAAAEAAAKAAAQAAAEARAAAIATAQTALATVLKGDKAGTLSEYRSANINITTTAALTRLNAEVLKLSAADRADFAKIKAIADKIEFDESFFNATARPSIATYSTYGVTGVTERILPTINAKVLELPAALRVDVKAMQDLVKVESFVDRVANTETRSTVSSNALIANGLLPSESPYKYSVVRGLGVYPEGSLNTMAKIEAAIKEQIYKAEAPKRRLAEIKARIAARNK